MATKKTREPVRLYGALMSGWLVVLGGQAFTDLLPKPATGLLVLGTAAVKVGVDEYVRGQVVPVDTNDPAPLQD